MIRKLTWSVYLFLSVMVIDQSCVMGAPTIDTPTLSPASIYIGIPTTVTMTVKITDPTLIKSSLNLLLLDENGKSVAILGSFRDDGLSGDLTSNDNTYTFRSDFVGNRIGQMNLKISGAFKGLLKRVFSPTFQISVLNNSSPDFTQDIIVGPLDPGKIVMDQNQMDVVIDRVLVVFKPSATNEDIKNAVNKVNGSIVGQNRDLNLYDIQVPTVTLEQLDAILTTLESDQSVEFASKDTLLKPSQIDNESLPEKRKWPFTNIKAFDA